MKLSIKDQLVILLILPKQGRLIEMQTVAGIIEAVRFSPEEIKDYNLRDTETGPSYDIKKERDIDIALLPQQIEVLQRAISRLDEQGGISVDMLSTIEKINSFTLPK